LATKSPEKVPSCVPPMFLHLPGVRSRHSRANNSDSPVASENPIHLTRDDKRIRT